MFGKSLAHRVWVITAIIGLVDLGLFLGRLGVWYLEGGW